MNDVKEKLKDFKIFSKNINEIPLMRLVVAIYTVCLGIVFGFSQTSSLGRFLLLSISFLSFIGILRYYIKRKKHVKLIYQSYLKEQIIIENQHICLVNNSKNKEQEYFYLVLKNFTTQEEYNIQIKQIEKLKNSKDFKEQFESIVSNKNNYVKNHSIGLAIQRFLEQKLNNKNIKLINSSKKVYTMYVNEKNTKVGYGVKYY